MSCCVASMMFPQAKMRKCQRDADKSARIDPAQPASPDPHLQECGIRCGMKRARVGRRFRLPAHPVAPSRHASATASSLYRPAPRRGPCPAVAIALDPRRLGGGRVAAGPWPGAANAARAARSRTTRPSSSRRTVAGLCRAARRQGGRPDACARACGTAIRHACRESRALGRHRDGWRSPPADRERGAAHSPHAHRRKGHRHHRRVIGRNAAGRRPPRHRPWSHHA
jgi:hypothetical protein